MNTCCVVVIGHVDHGKTALVRALSGVETDRLAEEKARGLSIVPGFAYRNFAGGTLDLIDAPGHEDFIQAMVGAAAGARAALIVISAVEGICAQTWEHLNIVELLGVTQGVIALNKCDLLTSASMHTRVNEIRQALASTAFAEAPIVPCSALNGEGCDSLSDALEALLKTPSRSPAPMHAFLPIDRVFSRPGLGTIVTGTLLGKGLSVGEDVAVLPTGQRTSIRGVQSRGEVRDEIHAGERAAVNLRGVALSDIARGAVLCADHTARGSSCFDAQVTLLAQASRPLKHMDNVRVLIGTSSDVVQVRLFGAGRIAPGETGIAQLRFQKSAVGFAGQRAVLRLLSPSETLGGIVVLDPQAAALRAGDKGHLKVLQAVVQGDVDQIASAMSVAGGGVAQLSVVARLARVDLNEVEAKLSDTFDMLGADLIASKEAVETSKNDLLHTLARYHAEHPLERMAPLAMISKRGQSQSYLQHVLAILSQEGTIRQQDNGMALADHDPMARLTAPQTKRIAEIEATFSDAGLVAPAVASLMQNTEDNALLALLLDAGALISLKNVALDQTVTLHADALKTAAARLADAFPAPQSFTTSEARSLLTTSRRIIVPVLEFFDSNGITLRTGDTRQINPANAVSPQSES